MLHFTIFINHQYSIVMYKDIVYQHLHISLIFSHTLNSFKVFLYVNPGFSILKLIEFCVKASPRSINALSH